MSSSYAPMFVLFQKKTIYTPIVAVIFVISNAHSSQKILK